MLPDVSAAARGEVGVEKDGGDVGVGERVRRWVRRFVCGVREVSISCRQRA